jgi:hypothetical protein
MGNACIPHSMFMQERPDQTKLKIYVYGRSIFQDHRIEMKAQSLNQSDF